MTEVEVKKTQESLQDRLAQVLEERKGAAADSSYVASIRARVSR